jgi:VWFA-related protein
MSSPLDSLAPLLLLTAAVAAQQPQTTFRSRADLVQVDVVVVDKQGMPVRGLKAVDFALLDRKKPQAIAAFEEIAHERDSRADTLAALPAALKRDVASNQNVQANRLIVLVVDDLHIYKGRTDRAKAIAGTVVNDLGPQASMAVLFTSGKHSTQVTDDRSVLLAAVDTLTGRKAWRRPHQATNVQRAAGRDPEASMEAALANLEKAQGTNPQEFFENIAQYETLRDAARLLGNADGRRKAFVLISEGIGKDLSGIFGALAPAGAVPRGGSSYADGGGGEVIAGGSPGPTYHEDSLIAMMEAMRRANVATYAIDPRGRVSSQQVALEMFPSTGWTEPPVNGTDPGFRWNNPVRQAQDGLQIMAQASGGFAVTDTDDFTSGIRKIVQDLDHYYLLGFYPADVKGKGYRPLDVKVPGHPEWTLRFRHGYLPGAAPAAPKDIPPLVALSAGMLPKGDLPLRLIAIPMPGTDKTARVALALEVSVPVAGLREVDARLRDELKYEVLAVNEKRSKVTSLTGRSGRLTLSPGTGAGAAPDRVLYQIGETVDLPPGRYQLRVSAISAKLGTGGSVYLDVDVPDFAASPLPLSGLAIGYASGPRIPVAPAQPGRPQSLPFAPTLDREFTASDTLRLHFKAASRTPGVPLRTLIEVLDDTNYAVASYSPSGGGIVELEIPLKTLRAGAYILRATVADDKHGASRAVGFVIR